MKLIKRVYYPIMAVLAAFVLVIGFMMSGVAGAPKTDVGETAAKAGIDFAKVFSGEDSRNGLSVDGITDARRLVSRSHAELLTVPQQGWLEDGFTIAEVTTDDDGFDVTEDADAAGYSKPYIAVQRSTPNSDTVRAISTNDNRIVYVSKTVQNVIAYIPGTDTRTAVAGNNARSESDADVLLISVRLDAIGPEATNAAVVGSAISHAMRLAQAQTNYKNDILFVFADGGIEHSMGLYTFLNQFKGFDGVVERIQLAVDFDTRGNDGALTMYQASGNADKFLQAYAKLNGTTQTNSMLGSFLEGTSTAGNAAAHYDIPALSFANIGNLRDARTENDNLDTNSAGAYINLNETVVRAHSEMMARIVDTFGQEDLAALADGSEVGVYFDYAGILMIHYPAMLAMVMAAIVLALLLAVVLVNLKAKAFSFVKVLLGGLIQFLAAVGAALGLYAVYFTISLLLAGFGVITLGAAALFSFASPGIMLSGFVVFGAFLCGFYGLLKKSFQVKAADVARGNVVLTAIVAMLVAFIAPAISYLFTTLAILQLVVLLVVALVKTKFRSKFGYDIERLFLLSWASIICVPLFVAAMNLSFTVTSIVMLPVFALMFSMPLGAILPFADYLKPLLNKGMGKLPARTVRYEKMVTEQVEDRAKKGKFTTVTSKKVLTEKVAWRYRNALGVSVVAFVAAISLLLCSSIGVGGFDARIVSNPKTAESYFFDNAFSYVHTNDHGTVTSTFEVRDRQAYSFISEAVTDLDWNSTLGAYQKTAVLKGVSIAGPSTPVKSGREVIYKTATERSRVVLTVTGAKSTQTFTFNSAQNQADFIEETEYTYENAGADKLTFVFPYGWNHYIQVKYTGGSGLVFSFEEQTDESVAMSLGITEDSSVDVRNLRVYAAGLVEVRPVFNMIFRTSVTV